MSMKVYLALVCSLVFFGSGVAYAQLTPPAPKLTITLSPTTPEAGEEVTASLQTHTLSSNPRSITWSVNGATQSAAANQQSMTFTAPSLSTRTVIQASVTDGKGTTHQARNTFVVSQLDIIVDARTTTPGFYQGRPEASIGSEVKLTALLKGAAPSSHTYIWKLNGTVLNNGPVRGGYTQKLTLPMGRRATIGVAVYDNTNTLIADKSIAINATEPEVLFYEDNALRGMMTRALLNSSIISGSEVTVRAEPYFLSQNISSQNLHREWSINGRTTQSQNTNKNSITLEKAGSSRFLLEFHIRNLDQLLQGAKESVRISF